MLLPHPPRFGYGSCDFGECLVELVPERVGRLVVVEELFHSPLNELSLEEGKLSVEVTDDDDSGHIVSLDEVLDQGEDLVRPLSDVGVVDRFEVAGEDVERDLLVWYAAPAHVRAKGFDQLCLAMI